MYSDYNTSSLKYARRCNECGCTMAGGFNIFDGGVYYCSEDCLHLAVAKRGQPSRKRGFVSYKGTAAGLLVYLEDLKHNTF